MQTPTQQLIINSQHTHQAVTDNEVEMKPRHALSQTLCFLFAGLSTGCNPIGSLYTSEPSTIHHIEGPTQAKVGQTVEISVWAFAGPHGGYDLRSATTDVDSPSKTVTVRAKMGVLQIPLGGYAQMVRGYKLTKTFFTPKDTGTYHIQAAKFSPVTYFHYIPTEGTSSSSASPSEFIIPSTHPEAGTPAVPASPSATFDIIVTAQ